MTTRAKNMPDPHHVVRILDVYYGAELFPTYGEARKRAFELSRQRHCVVVRSWVTGVRYSARELTQLDPATG